MLHPTCWVTGPLPLLRARRPAPGRLAVPVVEAAAREHHAIQQHDCDHDPVSAAACDPTCTRRMQRPACAADVAAALHVLQHAAADRAVQVKVLPHLQSLWGQRQMAREQLCIARTHPAVQLGQAHGLTPAVPGHRAGLGLVQDGVHGGAVVDAPLGLPAELGVCSDIVAPTGLCRAKRGCARRPVACS